MKGGHGQISYMTLLWVHLTIHLVHPINSQLCRITGQLSFIIINNNYYNESFDSESRVKESHSTIEHAL